jgi:hypothetical protein
MSPNGQGLVELYPVEYKVLMLRTSGLGVHSLGSCIDQGIRLFSSEIRYIFRDTFSLEKYPSHPVIFVLLGVVKPWFEIV